MNPINNYRPKALLVLLAIAVLAALLLALAGAKPAWAESRTFALVQKEVLVDSGTLRLSADFNGDGKDDLVVAPYNKDYVSVLLGKGDGTFQANKDSGVGFSSPVAATSADFNADGKVDLATANQNSDNVSVLLGKGDGTFQDAQPYTVGDSPSSITSADFNADGYADLANTNRNSNRFSVLMGNGDGTFQEKKDFYVGALQSSITSSDFDADGYADLAISGGGLALCFSSDPCVGLSVSLANSDGTFQDPLEVGVGEGWSTSVTSADIDHDSKADLVTTYSCMSPSCTTEVSVRLGNGDGTFQGGQNFAAGDRYPRSVITPDFNGDNYPDLAVGADGPSVRVLLNVPPGLPDTTIDSGPAGAVTSNSASFYFSSSEAGSGFECSLDDSAWAECTSPKTVPDDGVLADGSHTFEVSATNSAGGDPTPASRTWTVDTTAPTVGSVYPADPATGVVPTDIDVTATFSEAMDPDSISAATFTLKKGNTTGVSGQVSYDDENKKATLDPTSDLEANTSYTATIKSGDSGAKDASGTPLTQDYTWSFTTVPDTIPPDTTITSGPDNSTERSKSATFAFSAASSESGTSYKCKLDSASYEPCTSPQTYNDLSEGLHTFSVKAIDQAGNEEADADAATRSWTVDLLPTVVSPIATSKDSSDPSSSKTLRNTDIAITFSEAMNRSTLENPRNYQLKQGSKLVVAVGIRSVSQDNKTVILDTYPGKNTLLAKSTTYTVTVFGQSGVKDDEQNPLASNYSENFTTGTS